MTHPTKAIYKWLIQDNVRVQYVLPLLRSCGRLTLDHQEHVFLFRRQDSIVQRSRPSLNLSPDRSYRLPHHTHHLLHPNHTLSCRPRPGSRYVLDRNRWSQASVHWRLLSRRRQTFDLRRDTERHQDRRPDHREHVRHSVTYPTARTRDSSNEEHHRYPEPRRQSAHASLRSRASPGDTPDLRRILGTAPRIPEDPHLLRLQPRPQMHGRLPNLRRRHE